jgi:DNA adenine methylase
MESIIRYVGSKWRLAPKLIPLFPDYKCYVEPFCGSLAMLFSKQKTRTEVVNDIDSDLINLYEILRCDHKRFAEKVFYTPFSRQLYNYLCKHKEEYITPLDKAWFYYAANRMGWTNILTKDSIRVDTTGADPAQMHAIDKLFNLFIDRMNNVFLENKKYNEVISQYDKEHTFFYCDPPYYTTEDTYAASKFDEDDHRFLALKLKNIKGKAMVSYYESEFIDSLYKGWNKEVFTLLSRQKKEVKKEVIYFNYEKPGQLTLPIMGAL